MKNFEKALTEIKKLNLPSAEFIVVGGACLAVHNLRDTNDIDILVTKELWNELIFKYEIIQTPFGESLKLRNSIEVLGKGSVYLPEGFSTVKQLLETSQYVNGVNYADLTFVKQVKLQLARPKDLIDVELIDEYLGLHTVM